MAALTVADWCAFGLLIFGVVGGSIMLFLRARYLIRKIGRLLGLLVVADTVLMTWMLGQTILLHTGMVW